MSFDPHAIEIPVGAPVHGHDNQLLGYVREVHPHYLLVGQNGQHADLDVPVHAIVGYENGVLRVSVTRESTTEVDDVESAHRMGEE